LESEHSREEERLNLSEHPITYYFANKFVITEDRAYLVPYRRELCWPCMRDILGEIFNLDDRKVFRVVRDRLAVGRIIVGDYFPSTGEVVIQVPLQKSQYTAKRIKEVFGDV
jgi:hypothetical protein